MKQKNVPGTDSPSGDPADRQDLLTRIALGESLESAAEIIGIPISVCSAWLADPTSQIRIGEIRSGFAQSLAANGASVVASALEVVGDSLISGQWDERAEAAAKLVVASGAMGRVFGDATAHLDTLVKLREQADRLAFLDKLRELGLTEEEWSLMMRPSAPSAPRGRPRKK